MLEDKVVLCTGASGFIGSYIVEDLLKQKAKVIAIDINLSNTSNIPSHIFYHPNFVCEYCDIRDMGRLTEIFVRYKIDLVCHQAALASMPMSFVRPDECIETNVLGTANIFDISRRCGVKRVVYASSSAIYGASSPYAYSKMLDEKLAEMYNSLYDMECIGMRYFNVFGPRQQVGDNCAVIPTLINTLQNNKNPIIYGDGEQTRDFIFVRDVSSANICALKYTGENRVFNIGSGVATSINKLCQLLAIQLDKNVNIQYMPEREGDVKFSQAESIYYTQTELNWEINTSLVQGLFFTSKSLENK